MVHRSTMIHGGTTWSIPEDAWEIIMNGKYEWIAHSHPTFYGKTQASKDDRNTLAMFTWQEKK